MDKLWSLQDGQWQPFSYPPAWACESAEDVGRLVIAPGCGHVALLLDLARCWSGRYGVLYVLVVPRGGHEEGRYQCPQPVAPGELERFLAEHRDFLESDGRHHLWVAPAFGNGNLVYDRHEIIYAYGPLHRFVQVLERKGIPEGAVEVPVPHRHDYHPDNDVEEGRLLEHWEWVHFPLQAEDGA